MLEVLLMVVAVEDREAEHAACDLLCLLLQLCQMLLGVICKSPGGELRARWGIIIFPPPDPSLHPCRFSHPPISGLSSGEPAGLLRTRRARASVLCSTWGKRPWWGSPVTVMVGTSRLSLSILVSKEDQQEKD